jgi:hypothetical protein
MSFNQLIVIFYIFLWGGSRIRGCVRRWRQPLLRGPEWFFNVRVQSDFYTSRGKPLLDRYRLRMLMPFALEIPVATAIFISGHVQYLTWLAVAMGVLIHVNHLFSVDLKERQARAFTAAEAEEPVPAMVLSLKTRTLSQYSNRTLDRVLLFATIGAIACLLRFYFSSGHHDWRMFTLPALALYMEGGLLFAKRVILAWRTPVPQVQAEEHLEARERNRRFYLAACDLYRIQNISLLAAWPFVLGFSQERIQQFFSIWIAIWMAISVIIVVWGEVQRKKILTAALRVRPVKFPDFLGLSNAPNWPVCYQPSAPTLVLKGARGYSLNFANALIQFGALYLTSGVALFIGIWRMGH